MGQTNRLMLTVAAILALCIVVSPQDRGVPTFTKDVASIFQEKCQSCHRPDSIAPMSLVTYEQSRPYARSIRQRVITRNMPPWHIDKTVGIQHFANDRSLSEQGDRHHRALGGSAAPQGDVKDMPKPKVWADERRMELCAAVWRPSGSDREDLHSYTVPAVAVDAWYKPTVETGLTEPRWVRAIEIRPSTVKGRKVTHHALARLLQRSPVHHRRIRWMTVEAPQRALPRRKVCSWNGPSENRARSCVPIRES